MKHSAAHYEQLVANYIDLAKGSISTGGDEQRALALAQVYAALAQAAAVDDLARTGLPIENVTGAGR